MSVFRMDGGENPGSELALLVWCKLRGPPGGAVSELSMAAKCFES